MMRSAMTATEQIEVLAARWQAPRRVRALTTLRSGGVSGGPFASLNLGDHVGDDPGHVAENRRRVRHAFNLPAEPGWLRQVHGTRCIDLTDAGGGERADGSYTELAGRVCAVLTADCLPLFLCDAAGERVGLFHVGWRGLAEGIVEQALAIFADRPGVHCWLGPSIGAQAFEIGPEVRDALATPDNGACFTPSPRDGRWLADLYGLVAHRLRQGGLHDIAWDEAVCTYSDGERFFSHRRAGQCGRMASLIWIDARR